MRNEFLEIVGAIVIGLVIIIGTLAGIQMLSVSPLWGESGAAWVQAIGSVVAILVAVGVAAHQHSTAERLRQAKEAQADHEYTDLCLAIAIDTKNCLTDTRKKIEDRRHVGTYAIGNERYEQLLSALQTVMAKPIHPVLVREMLVLQREVAFTLTAIRELGTRVASDERIIKAMKREQRVERCVYALRVLRTQRRIEAVKFH